ncbi:MAG: carboxypeptidase regulatory-like domain-containing protein, partial [Vicinamibacterales bacterium]
MKTTSALSAGAAVVGFSLLLARAPVLTSAGQTPGAAVAVDADDLGGVVSTAGGPEAGVWVIAETADLPTKYVKIVVTDDRGRYLIPDLPKATFNIWVRGYG